MPRTEEKTLEELVEENRLLRRALGDAVQYIEGMRIVSGGVRDRLRRQWRLLLGEAAN